MNREEIIEIGAIGVGLVALYLVATRGQYQPLPQPVVSSTPAAGPEYIAYNYQPPSGNSMGNLASISPTSAPTSEPTGGCGCAQPQSTTFASPTSFSDFLSSQLSGIEDTYKNNLLSSMPNFFQQYINNSSGGTAENNSINQLMAFGG